VQFGAEGIGLCRTEHMFFDVDRIPAFRKMIVATNEADRRRALDTILPMQKEDFKGIYEAMEGRPVTIRLLDPPLHEFLPHEDKDIQALADDLGLTFDELKVHCAQPEGTQPHVGTPWLPSGRYLSGNC
jgi:pyruvate,orthophosphate dikinase